MPNCHRGMECWLFSSLANWTSIGAFVSHLRTIATLKSNAFKIKWFSLRFFLSCKHSLCPLSYANDTMSCRWKIYVMTFENRHQNAKIQKARHGSADTASGKWQLNRHITMANTFNGWLMSMHKRTYQWKALAQNPMPDIVLHQQNYQITSWAIVRREQRFSRSGHAKWSPGLKWKYSFLGRPCALWKCKLFCGPIFWLAFVGFILQKAILATACVLPSLKCFQNSR